MLGYYQPGAASLTSTGGHLFRIIPASLRRGAGFELTACTSLPATPVEVPALTGVRPQGLSFPSGWPLLEAAKVSQERSTIGVQAGCRACSILVPAAVD